ncbi:hypothetical protein VB620_00880 [Nodularia harveyana UHCC-0300]|uniref:Uncharacterized protein n=1 Tax=Nodularia harveyana UHCC-0300 TaxID=2974287 RepID=A0ABU5U8P5_9CYAN|nr:hypothetical protein [Nodularia harveyana]MEA5579892.1 hypothetical protein [Nodularia harveyana UHCC-0300]
MLNKISKLFTARKLKLPLLGLLLTIGVIGEQTKPVLSNQTPTISTNEPSVLSRFRQVREQRNLIRKIVLEKEKRRNLAESSLETANVKDEVKHRSRFVSSSKLLRNIKTTPEITSLFSLTPRFPRTNFPTQDGTYLYGQSPISDQIGQGYIVFENRQGKITGALYMPQSEFSCFQGAIEPSGELAMTVTSSPGEVGVNQIATANQFQIPNYNDEQTRTYPYSVALPDYHRISAISTNDQRILQLCQEYYTELS